MKIIDWDARHRPQQHHEQLGHDDGHTSRPTSTHPPRVRFIVANSEGAHPHPGCGEPTQPGEDECDLMTQPVRAADNQQRERDQGRTDPSGHVEKTQRAMCLSMSPRFRNQLNDPKKQSQCAAGHMDQQQPVVPCALDGDATAGWVKAQIRRQRPRQERNQTYDGRHHDCPAISHHDAPDFGARRDSMRPRTRREPQVPVRRAPPIPTPVDSTPSRHRIRPHSSA